MGDLFFISGGLVSTGRGTGRGDTSYRAFSARLFFTEYYDFTDLASEGANMLLEHLVLRCDVAHTFTVLAPYERKGFETVGVKSRGSGALIALRANASACAAGRAMVTAVRASLPAGATLLASASAAEALDWMYDALGPRELCQWVPEGDAEWVRADAGEELQGTHNGNQECFRLSDLMQPDSVGSAVGVRFCAQLRRDSYVPLLLPTGDRKRYEAIEEAASEWFKLEEDEKLDQAGAYGHVDRKFTGYRNGKFREQLECRSLAAGGLYPWPTTPPAFGPALNELLVDLDTAGRALLRHIARDVGATDDFFEALLDPPPPRTQPEPPSAVQEEDEADPALCHSLVRVCRCAPTRPDAARRGPTLPPPAVPSTLAPPPRTSTPSRTLLHPRSPTVARWPPRLPPPRPPCPSQVKSSQVPRPPPLARQVRLRCRGRVRHERPVRAAQRCRLHHPRRVRIHPRPGGLSTI